MDLAYVIEQAIKTALRSARVALPGRIVTYDADEQTAEVELQLEAPLMKLDARGEVIRGQHTYEELPRLYAVPVGHPRGGGFFIHFPMQPGDFVWVMFADHNLDEFTRTGKVSKPKDIRSHEFYPYALPAADPAVPNRIPSQGETWAAQRLWIGAEGSGGKGILMGTDGSVSIGGESNFHFMVKGNTLQDHLDDIKADLDDMKATFDDHRHVAPSGGGPTDTPVDATLPTPGPVTFPTPTTPPDVRSSKHKIDQ